jgi:quercetin dioxygenase-like cupin family protein
MSSEIIEKNEAPVRHYNPVQKDYATFLRSASEEEGGPSILEIEVHPGGGTSPHYHLSYAEHFQVIEGTLTVGVENRTYTLKAGECAVAPVNSRHYFRNNTTETVRFIVELHPGSIGFENAVKAAYGLARDGKTWSDSTPKNLYHLAILLDWSDIGMPGPMGKMLPLFRFLARRAKKKGIDRELFEKYCR